jgi:pyruvate dehydrogenase E2 component (dihydrolipoamide acetyltransferase)
MARWEFKLPDVGEGISEGEIVAWLVKAGDVVAEDQPIVEVMTDKATVTITAPKAGVVLETRGRVGDIVPVHSVLVVFELDGARPAPPVHANGTKAPDDAKSRPDDAKSRPDDAKSRPSADEPAATAVGELRETLPGMAAAGYFNDKPLATPATRKLARDMEVDLRRVPPSGPAGRVMRTDVEGFRHVPEAPRSPVSADTAAIPAAAPANDGAREAREERVPLVGRRRLIPHKLALSTSPAANYTLV